jgi:3-phenylpropionate/trans-cinnamate dioxygenase ferredoxin reductase subunit
MTSPEQTFVIVGASLAGAKAAETLRAEGFSGRVVLIGEETDRPYERPPLSKGYLQGSEERDKAFVHDASWYSANSVELLLGVTVTAISPTEHTVTIDDVEPLRYDKLLLATGSTPRLLSIAGSDNRGIHYLRRIGDSDALKSALREGTNVVVIGAGWIGLETAAAARLAGCPVTVVEMDSLPLRRVLGEEVATVFADLHRARGVTFRFESGVREFGGLGGEITHVVLDDGTEIPADVAIVGVGIRPLTELAAAADLAVDNGVSTDGYLRTSDPDIFAAGDVASYLHPKLNRSIRVEHWANALNGGPVAAKNMLGQAVSYDRVPYFFSDQYDLGMEYAGYVEPGGYDRVVFRGDASIVDGKAPEFVAFWIGDGKVLAGMNVNVWDVQDDIQALVRAGWDGSTVDLERLTDPSVPLGDLLG